MGPQRDTTERLNNNCSWLSRTHQSTWGNGSSNSLEKGIYAIKGAMEMLRRGKKTSCWEVRQGLPEELWVNAAIDSQETILG